MVMVGVGGEDSGELDGGGGDEGGVARILVRMMVVVMLVEVARTAVKLL